jgi:hypothetical protein
MGENRNAYRLLVGKQEGRILKVTDDGSRISLLKSLFWTVSIVPVFFK